MRYGPKNLRIAFTAKTLSHFGGVYLLYQFLTKLGLKSRIAHAIYISFSATTATAYQICSWH